VSPMPRDQGNMDADLHETVCAPPGGEGEILGVARPEDLSCLSHA
jgi:hypothetical protein